MTLQIFLTKPIAHPESINDLFSIQFIVIGTNSKYAKLAWGIRNVIR